MGCRRFFHCHVLLTLTVPCSLVWVDAPAAGQSATTLVPLHKDVWLKDADGRGGAAISISAMAFMLTGGHLIIPFFMEGDQPELTAMASRAMHLFSFSYLFNWIGTTAGSFFTAMNKPAVSLAVSFGQTILSTCLPCRPACFSGHRRGLAYVPVCGNYDRGSRDIIHDVISQNIRQKNTGAILRACVFY